MALIVFSQKSGQVVTFADPAFPGQISLKVDGWGGASKMKAIITRANLSAACNFQLMHALGGDAYLYVFGDRVGQTTLSGLAFETFCGEDKGTIGIENVVKFYNTNRLSARETPIKITIGGSLTIKAYMAGMQADVEDAAMRIWRFSLNFLEPPAPLPKNKNNDAGAGAGAGDGASSGTGADRTFPPYVPTDGIGSPNTRVDAGGYNPDAGPSPQPAGSGYSTYGTGPASPTANSFQVA